jgi:hypothetical protein
VARADKLPWVKCYAMFLYTEVISLLNHSKLPPHISSLVPNFMTTFAGREELWLDGDLYFPVGLIMLLL